MFDFPFNVAIYINAYGKRAYFKSHNNRRENSQLLCLSLDFTLCTLILPKIKKKHGDKMKAECTLTVASIAKSVQSLHK